jgi:hypothetical protein
MEHPQKGGISEGPTMEEKGAAPMRDAPAEEHEFILAEERTFLRQVVA